VADEAVERARTPHQVANLALLRADALPGRLIKARAAGGDAPLMDEIARRGPAPIALIRAEAQTAAGVRAIDPSRETLPDLRPDAAISTVSCGFHHPTAPCAEFLTRGIAPGGGVALGPRSICARSAREARRSGPCGARLAHAHCAGRGNRQNTKDAAHAVRPRRAPRGRAPPSSAPSNTPSTPTCRRDGAAAPRARAPRQSPRAPRQSPRPTAEPVKGRQTKDRKRP
jgi:hypothetical protein